MSRPRFALVAAAVAVAAIAGPGASGVTGRDTITTFAGTSEGFAGDGGPATGAKLYLPTDVAVDRNGNVYIADTGNNRIRRVAPSGTISTYAGTGSFYPFSGDGGPATAANLYVPEAIAVDAHGNLYIADRNDGVVRKVAANGIITTFAGRRTARQGVGDGGPATSAALRSPDGVAVDGRGNVYIADRDNNRIRKVDPSGSIATIAGTGAPGNTGTGGPATSAEIYQPDAVAVDGKGNVYFTEVNNNLVLKITPAGKLTRFAGDPALGATSFLNGLAVDSSGNVYVSDRARFEVFEVGPGGGTMTPVAGSATGPCCLSGDGGPAASAHLKAPYGLAVDARGDLYIADTQNDRIRKVTVGAAPAGSTAALIAYGRSIETDLSQLASGRAKLKSTLAAVGRCSLSPHAAGARLAAVVSNRTQILARVRALPAPTAQAARISSLLAGALTYSIAADRHYRGWLRYLQGRSRCSTAHNRDYVAAQREDRLATAAKGRFLAAFNSLARELHLRTWSTADI